MPIPDFTSEGILPEGIHECSLGEIAERFGQFQRTDARCRLFERLETFVREAMASGLVAAIIVDGSFVTAKDAPNDIDLILILRAGHDFNAPLRPLEYNIVSRRRVSRTFGFDMLVAETGQSEVEENIAFFCQVRERRDLRKGLLRLNL
jgi:hypothetical protein